MDQAIFPITSAVSLPDLAGDNYVTVLERLHHTLAPKTYLEIGVQTGRTLALARCAAIGVDPQFLILEPATMMQLVAKPALHLFQTGSDDFFALHRPDAIFGAPVDFAFLDGMHRAEFLLRDFINTERYCKKNSIIALHDCLPVEIPMTSRSGPSGSIAPLRQNMWTGDVWRTARLLARYRPDLSMLVLDAAPTGLVLITNLDPADQTLAANYDRLVGEMMSWLLEDIGLAAYHDEMGIVSTSRLQRSEDITERFWL